MNLNKAMLIGNLTRDPETKTTPTGQTVTTFGLATNLVWTDSSGEKQKKAEFHNIVAWRKLADICGQYLKKGNKIYIEGRLQTRDWEGQDGVKRYRTEIVADNMIMLDTKGSNSGGGASTSSEGEQSSPSGNDFSQPEPQNPKDKEDEIKVENIPF